MRPDSGTGVRLLPPQDPPDPEDAEQRRELRANELERVREAAGNWRTGLAAILALITTVSVVKGRDTIVGLPPGAQYAVGVCLLLALIAAAWGTFLGMRAAFGIPEVNRRSDKVRILKRRQAWEAIEDLERARWLTFIALALLTTAIGLTWYVPEEGPPAYVSAAAGDRKVCGELTKGGASTLTIKVDEETTETVSLSELASLRVVDRCSGK